MTIKNRIIKVLMYSLVSFTILTIWSYNNGLIYDTTDYPKFILVFTLPFAGCIYFVKHYIDDLLSEFIVGDIWMKLFIVCTLYILWQMKFK